MKKLVILIMVTVLCLTPFSFIKTGVFDSVTQVSAYSTSWSSYTQRPTYENGAYVIKNAKELAYISRYISSYRSSTIKLENDIDLSSHNWIPIGTTSSNYFYGTFDGQGHYVRNMYVASNSGKYNGLFGYVYSATIKNVYFENCTVFSKYYGGILAGFTNDCDKIYNINVLNSSVRADKDSENIVVAGGIVGRDFTSKISTCRVYDSTIYSNNSNAVKASLYAGGICGYKKEGTITLSCASVGTTVKTNAGTISYAEYAYAGGIVGRGESITIDKSYSMATINSNADKYSDAVASSAFAGGIIGYSDTSTIKNCFNRGSVNSYATSMDDFSSFEEKTGSYDTNYATTYAEKVNGNWTLYLAKGDAVFKNYNGSYATNKYLQKYVDDVCNSYSGGIAGYIVGTKVNYTYNSASITSNSYNNKRTATIYTKWVAWVPVLWWTEYKANLLIKTQISYVKQYNLGNIIGGKGSDNSVYSNYYETEITKSDTPSVIQTYEINGKDSGLKATYNKWGDTYDFSTKNTAWYLNKSNGLAYYTYFDVNTSDPKYIYLTAKYSDSKTSKEKTTYNILTTNVDYKKSGDLLYLDNYGTKGINLSRFSSSIWAKADYINNGYPYIKDMYW